jgi:hypothetical protein
MYSHILWFKAWVYVCTINPIRQGLNSRFRIYKLALCEPTSGKYIENLFHPSPCHKRKCESS